MSSGSVSAKSFSELYQSENNTFSGDSPKNGQVDVKNKSEISNNDPIIGKETVSLENKPSEMPLGEHLTRQALEKIAPRYGLNASDIELEIKYIKEKKGGDFIDNLSFGKNKIKNPDALSNEQINQLIAKGNKTVDFGIHQSTVERMQERRLVLQWVAEKEAFGGKLSDQDYEQLAQIGYSREDVAFLCNYKLMEYGGFQSRFETAVEEKAKAKIIEDTRNDLKNTLTEDNMRLNAQGNQESFDLLMNDAVNARVNDKLAYGKKTAIQYLAEQEAEKLRIEEKDRLNERLKQYGITDYLEGAGKNLLNSLYWGIGEAIKGLAVANEQQMIRLDGKEVKVSDTLGYKLGEWIQQNVQAPNVNPDIEQSLIGGTIPKTIGGLLPAVFGAWATKSPTATISIYDGLRTGGSIYDEARMKGATESQAQRAALLTGGFVGLTDRFGYGKTLETLNTGVGAKTWQSIFSQAIKEGGRNSVVAGGQTIFENGVAKQIYDPNRSYLQNVEQRMIAAGITGAALKGGLEIIARVRSGKNPSVLAETQRVFNLEPLNARQIEFRNSGIPLRRKLDQKLVEQAESVNNKRPLAANWNNVKGLIGKKLDQVTLPDDYFVSRRNGTTAIIRKVGDDLKFTPLSLDKQGRIQVGGADNRISNPYLMNKNYNEDLQARLTAKLGSAELAKIQVKEINGLITKHHILPDNVLQKTDLGVRALKAGYDLDRVNNLIGLADKAINKQRLIDLGEATPNQPGHWTSHPEYDSRVTNTLNRAKQELVDEYQKPLDQIPDNIILDKMKEIENEFRKLIQDGKIDTKDGRISMIRELRVNREINV